MYRLFTPFLLVTAVVAQTSAEAARTAHRFVPADSCLVVRMASPAKWKQQFEKTQVFKLLRAPTLAPLMSQMDTAIEAMLEELRTSGDFDADLVGKLLNDFEGDLVGSLQIDWDDFGAALQENRPPQMSFVIALAPGAGIDLAELANAASTAFERERGDELRDVTVGDLRLRVKASEGDDEPRMCVPFLVDEHLVMLGTIGGDFGQIAAHLLDTDDRYQGEITDAPLFVHAKVGSFMKELAEIAGAEADAGGAPFDVTQLITAFGLTALDTMTLSVSHEGEHATSSFEVTMGDGERGIFGAMLLDQKPQLLRLVPPGAEYFGIAPLDVNKLYTSFAEIMASMEDLLPITVEDMEASFAEETSVRLREDLLAHLGTEMLSLQDPGEEGMVATEDAEDPMAMLGGMCIAISLRDGKAFGESLEKVLRSQGLHAARKTEEYGDTKVYRVRPGALIDLEYAVTNDLLLLSIGKSEVGSRNLRAVLDARQNAAVGDRPTVLEEHLPSFAAGWNGVSVTPVATLIGTIRSVMEAQQAMGSASPETEHVIEVMNGVTGDMRRLGLQHMITVTYTNARSLTARYRW